MSDSSRVNEDNVPPQEPTIRMAADYATALERVRKCRFEETGRVIAEMNRFKGERDALKQEAAVHKAENAALKQEAEVHKAEIDALKQEAEVRKAEIDALRAALLRLDEARPRGAIV